MTARKGGPAAQVAERLCREQHIGLFGHRGVGKTTFLTMLYREAVGGRLPGLRLAAADARTASYLSDKILQLEQGEPLPATLGETELHFHLYHQDRSLDLLVKDYQGEHVALGREEPIKDFLRDCDAVWLCLDAAVTNLPADNLRSQQEVEQLVEDYLASEHPGAPARPMALVLTKADLLLPGGDGAGAVPDATAITALVDRRFGMTRHALTEHAPTQHAFLAVSSLGRKGDRPAEHPRFDLEPAGLGDALLWLIGALRALDLARMEYVWQKAGSNLELLERCVKALERRYPNDPEVLGQRRRLALLQRRRRRRRSLAGLVAMALLVLGVWTYDALGEQRVRRFEQEHPQELTRVVERWQAYQRWHPTRHLFRPAARAAEEEHLHRLGRQAREQEADARLADIRRQADDPDSNPEAVWAGFLALKEEYPEKALDDALEELRERLRVRREIERERRAGAALEELVRVEQNTELAELVARGGKLLEEFGDTKKGEQIRERVETYLYRIDERDIQAAREYSARQPFSFHTRREHYQHYLERHPEGAFVSEAKQALGAIEVEWDKHDFRSVRDHFQRKPGEVRELETRCLSYLAAHPQGKYVEKARELLRWCEQVAVPRDYRVTLVRGSFDPDQAHLLSRGLHLSVEIEVNGVIYGPSTIVKRSSEPEWNYQMPRPIRWKLGDRVIVRVTDNYYWKRHVADFSSAEDDPLAMRMLSSSNSSGKNSLVFESDFHMPVLPRLE